MIAGLPPTGSWQDLKDHMREAGDVCYADTYKDGTGMVEFLRYEDMKYAIKKLDDSRFRSHEVRYLLWYFILTVIHLFFVFREKFRMCESKRILEMVKTILLLRLFDFSLHVS